MTGRPTRCTELLTAAVVKRIGTGSPETLAVQAEGVSAQSWSEWRSKAARELEPYRTFVEAVAQARARYLCDGVALINAAGYGGDEQRPDWKATAWLAERTAPDEFAPSQTIVFKAQADANRAVLTAARELAAAHPEAMTGAQWFAALLTSLLPADEADDEHAEH